MPLKVFLINLFGVFTGAPTKIALSVRHPARILKPNKPNPRPPTNIYLIYILIVSSHLYLCVLSLSALRSKTLYEFLFYPFIATSSAHSFLRIFTPVLFVGRHKSWSTSLRNPFLSSVMHYLLSPNMFLGILYLNTLYIYTHKYMRFMLCDIFYSCLCGNNVTTKKDSDGVSYSYAYLWIVARTHTHTHL